jgi:hypothetical protein
MTAIEVYQAKRERRGTRRDYVENTTPYGQNQPEGPCLLVDEHRLDRGRFFLYEQPYQSNGVL